MHIDYSQKKLISIISPVLNEEESISLFYGRMQKVLSSFRNRYNFELIFTNNRSTDNSLNIICQLREKDPNVQVLTMSRNFGYQASVQAGLSFGKGEALIVIDADCEDPPEMITQFIEKWESGYDIVYGVRDYGHRESWLLKKFRKVFYRLLHKLADMDIVLYMAEFSLMSSSVRDAIINNKNTFPFLRSEIGYVGFSRFGIPFVRQPRQGGKTNYNIFQIFSFAFAGFLTSSTFLFRFAGYAFLFLVLLNVFFLFISGLFKFLLVIDFVYVIGLLTMHGLYIARIYKNVMGRPIFVIDKKLSFINNNVDSVLNFGVEK